MTVRRISSWRERASDIAFGILSQREVEPSTSVKRKVILPVCGSAIRFASFAPDETNQSTEAANVQRSAHSEVQGAEILWFLRCSRPLDRVRDASCSLTTLRFRPRANSLRSPTPPALRRSGAHARIRGPSGTGRPAGLRGRRDRSRRGLSHPRGRALPVLPGPCLSASSQGYEWCDIPTHPGS